MGGVIPVILLECTDITVWKGLLKNTKFSRLSKMVANMTKIKIFLQ